MFSLRTSFGIGTNGGLPCAMGPAAGCWRGPAARGGVDGRAATRPALVDRAVVGADDHVAAGAGPCGRRRSRRRRWSTTTPRTSPPMRVAALQRGASSGDDGHAFDAPGRTARRPALRPPPGARRRSLALAAVRSPTGACPSGRSRSGGGRRAGPPARRSSPARAPAPRGGSVRVERRRSAVPLTRDDDVARAQAGRVGGTAGGHVGDRARPCVVGQAEGLGDLGGQVLDRRRRYSRARSCRRASAAW